MLIYIPITGFLQENKNPISSEPLVRGGCHVVYAKLGLTLYTVLFIETGLFLLGIEND
jgi:hypothetical protein